MIALLDGDGGCAQLLLQCHQALIGAPIADPRDPVEVGHVARSFDSCLVCTVHAHDGKTGKELARFRVG